MWFGARLIFQSVHTGKPNPEKYTELTPEEINEVLYEESVILIQADDENSAMHLAREVGVQKEHSYENMYGETVTWQLIEVAEVKEVVDNDIGHGTEVFYRFFSNGQGSPPTDRK